MKKILAAILVLAALGASIVLVNAWRTKPGPVFAEPGVAISVDESRAAEHLSRSVQIQTISHQDPAQFNGKEFLAFHEYLRSTFPKMHQALTRETAANYSLLYTWKGKNPEEKPLLLMAHMDVVPVIQGTEDNWRYPAFAGRIAEGFIWGRGTLDDKVSLLAICEAVERLVSDGFQPGPTIYLAFAHDEEVGGSGSRAIVSLLKSRGVRLGCVLDESGSIFEGTISGVKKPVAMVGIAEKGYLSVELSAESEGGHAAMPLPHTTIGVLASAIHRLEKNQFPARLSGVTRQMFSSLAPAMPFKYRLLFANLWLFHPLLIRELEKSPETAASIRTTTAATIFQAGVKEKVLPNKARAVVNFRLLPGDSISYVLNRIQKTINDPEVKVIALPNSSEPSPVSDVRSASYKTLQKTILQVFPEVMVAPYLVLGATDSRHYVGVSESIFKFLPTRLKPEDLKREHGVNERVGVKNYGEIIKFFIQFIENFGRV